MLEVAENWSGNGVNERILNAYISENIDARKKFYLGKMYVFESTIHVNFFRIFQKKFLNFPKILKNSKIRGR